MQHETKQVQLENGSRLLIINVPNSVSIYFGGLVRSGYRFCDPAKYELPHLLEHLAFEGNKKYPDPSKFKAEVEKEGAYFNAWTNPYRNVYEFVAGPAELAGIVRLGLYEIFEPLFEDKRIEQEKETVAHELNRNIANDARKRGYLNSLSSLPKLYQPWEDRIAGVKTVTRQEITDFYANFYGTKNTAFILAGDFTATQIKQVTDQLNQALAGYPAGQKAQYLPLPLRPGKLAESFDAQSANQNHFFLSFNIPGYHEPDFAALRILTVLFSGGMSGRMQIKARQQGLTYTFGSSYDYSVDSTGIDMADQTTPDKLEPLVQLAVSELLDIAAGNFTDEELKWAIGFSAGGLRRSIQVPASFAGWYSEDFMMERDLESPTQRINKILAVTRADIISVAKKYLKPDNWTLTILGQNSDKVTAKLDSWITSKMTKFDTA